MYRVADSILSAKGSAAPLVEALCRNIPDAGPIMRAWSSRPFCSVSVANFLLSADSAVISLSACASDRPFGRDVTGGGQFERAPADCQVDCQNRAAPVSEAVLVVASVRAAPGAGEATFGTAGDAGRQTRTLTESGNADATAGAARKASRGVERVAAR